MKFGLLIMGICLMLTALSCDDSEDGGSGVCLHDFGDAYECKPETTEDTCNENGWDWVDGQTCDALGYTSYCSANSYTAPGTCPF